MGAYLTKPNTEKQIEDGTYGKLIYGSCSMQGWRVSQEDAHNTLPDFDPENRTSFFAVYDGHGGAEVAKYCSVELPNYLATLPSYQDDKDMSKALTEAFLGFDANLLEEPTIEKLRQLSDSGKEEPRLDEDEDEEDDTSALKEEATLPLENVLEKYGGIESLPPCLKQLMMFRKKQEFKSPCVSNKRRKQTADASSSGDNTDHTETAEEKSSKDSNVSNDTSAEVTINGNEEKSEDKKSVPNGVDTEIKENGLDNEKHENGSSDSPIAVAKEKIKETSDEDEEDDEWNGDADKAEDSEEEEEEEDDEEDSGVDEDEEEDDDEDEEDDDDEDDDEDDDDVDDENVLSFGQQMDDSEPGVDSGTTAVVALIRDRQLVVANAGDSRCVLCREGKAVDLSVDHKPEDQPEKDRIGKAGGVVTQEGRVNGGLNLSRAIGDHSYKKNDDLSPSEQMITALPDIQSVELDPEKDSFIILACDGIWNSLTSQEVVDFVKERLTDDKKANLSDICGELFDSCLAEDTVGDGTGCDNMTCVLVRFDWSASDPAPSLGKVKGIKRNQPPHDDAGGDEQTAKKSRLESD